MSIKFTDVCFITTAVLRLRAFYESVFGDISEGDEWHSTLRIDNIHIVFLRQKNSNFYYYFVQGGNNTILSFNVEDLDAEYKRLLSLGAKVVCEPITHPWGARSFQFKDPDGNILNFRTIPKEEQSC